MLVSTYQFFTSDIQLFDRLKGASKNFRCLLAAAAERGDTSLADETSMVQWTETSGTLLVEEGNPADSWDVFMGDKIHGTFSTRGIIILISTGISTIVVGNI